MHLGESAVLTNASGISESFTTGTATPTGDSTQTGRGVLFTVAAGEGSTIPFDALSFDITPVPEPSTALLGVLACLRVATRRSR